MHSRPSMLEARKIGDRGTTKADGIRGAGVSATSRKFLGCKRRLARWVADSIFAVAGKPDSFIDGFCGTGAIGLEMLSRGVGHVTCVDNLLSNTVILDGVLSGPDPERLRCALSHLNAVRPQPGYATHWYADTYFTRDNCMRIDAIRPQVDQLLEAGRIGPRERSALLASLLLACDRVANTVGQYDAYLKHLGSRPIEGGRHLVDSRVYEPLRLAPLRTIEAPGAQVLTGDLLDLAPRIDAEVVYLDPPYTTRQYIDNYHVLENIARWQQPELSGKTRKFPRSHLKSPFSTRRGAARAIGALLEALRARWIMISYNSEGIVPIADLVALARCHGPVRMLSRPYPVFGGGAGVARRRSVTECLVMIGPRR